MAMLFDTKMYYIWRMGKGGKVEYMIASGSRQKGDPTIAWGAKKDALVFTWSDPHLQTCPSNAKTEKSSAQHKLFIADGAAHAPQMCWDREDANKCKWNMTKVGNGIVEFKNLKYKSRVYHGLMVQPDFS